MKIALPKEYLMNDWPRSQRKHPHVVKHFENWEQLSKLAFHTLKAAYYIIASSSASSQTSGNVSMGFAAVSCEDAKTMIHHYP